MKRLSKHLSIFLILFVLFSCGTNPNISSINQQTSSDESNIHIHVSDGQIQENYVPATCTTDGGYDLVEYCVDDHYLMSKEHITIKALGHDLIYHEAKEASCLEDGHNECYTCSRCDYTTYEVVPATGHTHIETRKENIVPATCLSEGHYDLVSYCIDDGAEISRETLITPTTEHQYGYIVTPASYEQEGYVTYTCGICGDSYSEPGEPQLTHHYSDEWTYDSVSHYRKCTDEGYESFEIDLGEHQLSEPVIVKQPTEKEDGLQERTCQICGYKQETIIDKLSLDFSLNDDNQSYTLVGIGSITSSDIVIPSTYKGLPVTAIGHGAFYEKTITSVVIPENVISIGESAFYKCLKLKEVTFPKSLRDIGKWAFSECFNIEKVTFNDGLLSIGDSAFFECFNLKGINLPDTLTFIGINAFVGSRITSVNIPSSLKQFTCSFASCRLLENVTIADGIESIWDNAFFECESLTSINLPEGLKEIGNNAFCSCERLSIVTIPDSVTSIGSGAFSGCSSLTSIKLPKELNIISDSLFKNCSSLVSIEIPETVTIISSNAFSDCSSLKEISLPNGLIRAGEFIFSNCTALTYNIYEGNKYLGSKENPYLMLCDVGDHSLPNYTIHDDTRFISRAFYECKNLTSISLPAHLVFIGDESFYGCESLSSISLHEGLLSIGCSAFRGCHSLQVINVPSSVTYIGEYAFKYCKSLEAINVDVDNKYYSSFDGILYDKEQKTLFTCPYNKSGDTYIAETVTSIHDWSFDNLDDINFNYYDNACYIGTVSNPYFLLVKPRYDDISSLEINKDCRIILDGALYVEEEYSIKSIEIPSSVISIGPWALGGCIHLENITLPFVGGSRDANQSLRYLFNYQIPYHIKTLTIIEGCKEIPENAFNGFDIENLIIPHSVTKILDCAGGGESMTTINFPDELTYIGSPVGSNVKTVYMGDKVTFIHHLMSQGRDVDYYIRVSSLENLFNFTSKMYLQGNTHLLNGETLEEIKSVVIPSEMGIINDYAFWHCTSLEEVIIDEGINEIGDSAFLHCTSIKSITIPNSVTAIDDFAFTSCYGLSSVCFNGTLAQWQNVKKGINCFADTQVEVICCSDGDATL